MVRALVRAALTGVLFSLFVSGHVAQRPAATAFRVLGVDALRPASRVDVPPPGPLVYHGGPVMRARSVAYTIFWKPPGSFMSQGYEALINQYFHDVGGSALYGITAQYSDGGGHIANSSNLGGTWTDPRPYPRPVLNLQDILVEIEQAIQDNHWARSVNHVFFLYLARNEGACIDIYGQNFGCFLGRGGQGQVRSWCAVHAGFDVPAYHAVLIGALMPYAGTDLQLCGPQSVGAPAGPNNNPDADAEIGITSHEHLEAVTDPFDLGPQLSGVHAAWYVGNPFEGEIADKCAWQYGQIANDRNIIMNNHPYLVQEEWSNALNPPRCTL